MPLAVHTIRSRYYSASSPIESHSDQIALIESHSDQIAPIDTGPAGPDGFNLWPALALVKGGGVTAPRGSATSEYSTVLSVATAAPSTRQRVRNTLFAGISTSLKQALPSVWTISSSSPAILEITASSLGLSQPRLLWLSG